MDVIALLSWYDERPDWLAAAVASVAPFCSHVVAVDGAYMLFPGGRGQSPAGQAEAIRETARACKIGVTISEPRDRWGGNEVEKRSALFALGEQITRDANDWYFVIDGDELVTDSDPERIRAACVDTPHDVGVVLHSSRRGHSDGTQPWVAAEWDSASQFRKFFRAIPGLRVVENHYTYRTPDGRNLWGKSDMEEPEDFTFVRVEHRKDRDPLRSRGAQEYYERRDRLNIEGLKP